MKRFPSVYLFSFVFLFFATETIPTHVRQSQMSLANVNEFALKLQKVLYKTNENLIFSPISIYTGLSSLLLGSDKVTRDEISNVLELPASNNIQKVHENIRQLLETTKVNRNRNTTRRIEKNYHLRMNVANGIFLQNEIALKKSYEQNLKIYYSSEVTAVDFLTKGEEASNIINTFVAQNTRNSIPKLLSEPQSKDTRFILTTNLYFDALWNLEFDESNTIDAPFHLPDAEKITVKMMQKIDILGYLKFESLKFELVRMYFAFPSLSFNIILPEKGYSLNELLEKLSEKNLQKIFDANPRKITVDLRLPRIFLTWSENLKKPLDEFGIKKIFTETAELSRLTEYQGLKLDKVLHSAELRIKEGGTCGPSKSVSESKPTMRKQNRMDFEVNRPFLALIYDERTNSILSWSVVNNPGSS